MSRASPVPMRAAVRMALLAALTRVRLRQQAVHPGHSSNFARAEFVPHCSPHAPRAYSIVQRSEGARGARWREELLAHSCIPTG